MSTQTSGLSVHAKWLVSVVAGIVICFQGWSWVEGRIERRVTTELKTAQALSDWDGRLKDAQTWLDGRANTMNARLDALQREITTLRQDQREVDQALKGRLDALPAR